MNTNTLFRAAARIITPTLAAAAVLTNVSPASAATPAQVQPVAAVTSATTDGPATCNDGFVWRESPDGDTVCVTVVFRVETTPSRNTGDAGSMPPVSDVSETGATDRNRDGKVDAVFEVTGSGVADNVTIDDGPVHTSYDLPLPVHQVSRVPADIDLLQVHVSGTHDSGTSCRILLDGHVVASSNTGDCVYNR